MFVLTGEFDFVIARLTGFDTIKGFGVGFMLLERSEFVFVFSAEVEAVFAALASVEGCLVYLLNLTPSWSVKMWGKK